MFGRVSFLSLLCGPVSPHSTGGVFSIVERLRRLTICQGYLPRRRSIGGGRQEGFLHVYGIIILGQHLFAENSYLRPGNNTLRRASYSLMHLCSHAYIRVSCSLGKRSEESRTRNNHIHNAERTRTHQMASLKYCLIFELWHSGRYTYSTCACESTVHVCISAHTFMHVL